MTGSLFIVSAPSGAGKSSLLAAVMQRIPSAQLSVSHTTRQKRTSEIDRQDYYFVAETTFNHMKEQGDFLEHAMVFKNHYGTSKALVYEFLEKGKDVILEIDWQGANQVRAMMPNAISIFILPPSYATLSERLIQRNTDDPETIQLRLAEALDDIQHCQHYDYVVVNDDFLMATDDLCCIINSVKLRTEQQLANVEQIISEFNSD